MIRLSGQVHDVLEKLSESAADPEVVADDGGRDTDEGCDASAAQNLRLGEHAAGEFCQFVANE